MKAMLNFEGKDFPVEIGDSFVIHLKAHDVSQPAIPVNETLAEKFERMIADLPVGDAIMFGSRSEVDGSFTLDSGHDEILPDYSLAIGAESTGDGNFVPIFDRSCAETIFDEVVQNNLSVSGITISLGGYFNREYDIEESDVNVNWVEVFNDSSEYQSAFEQWIEDSTDDYAVISIHDVVVGHPVFLGSVTGFSNTWVPLV